MAKLKIDTGFLASVLFGQTDKKVAIVGAQYDRGSTTVVLDIVGDCVPDCQQVEAIFTTRPPMTVEFKAVN